MRIYSDSGFSERLSEHHVGGFTPHTGESGHFCHCIRYFASKLIDEHSRHVQQVLGFAYAAPVQGTVTDGFGWRENAFHYGTDIAADAGTVISSFADGTVTAVGDSSQLGNYVTVSHDGAFTTLYAHCSRITASSGQQVALGDPIAEVGETGNATGPHLHFAIQKDTVYLDPAYYGIG